MLCIFLFIFDEPIILEKMAHDNHAMPDNVIKSKQWSYEVLKQFRLIFKSIQQHSQWVETHCGVSSAQLWALSEIHDHPGLKVTDLAKAMSLHHSTASSLLNKLSSKGLIKRERIHQDQRLVTLVLTETGVELLQHVQVPPQGILQHALFHLPEAELKSLCKNLEVLVKQMEIKDKKAAMQPLNPILLNKSRSIEDQND